MSDKKKENEDDLKSKFQRLAQEYQKIKSQNTILKKAIIQEQQKSKDLEVQLKEKEAVIRSTHEENELLNFNNQRLTKRLSILQAEIAEHNKNVETTSWFSSAKKTDIRRKQDLEVATQELAVKIEENERLHIKIFEQTQSYKATLKTLEDQITQMKDALKLNDLKFNELHEQHQSDLEKYDNDLKLSNNKVNSLDIALQRMNLLMTKKDEEYSRVKRILEEDLDKAQDLIERKLHYDDTCYHEFNKHNLPSVSRVFRKRGMHIIKEGVMNIENFSRALKEFYQYLLKRVGYNYKILETLSAEENVPQILHAHQQIQKTSNLIIDSIQKISDCFSFVVKEYNDHLKLDHSSKLSLSNAISQFIVYNSQIHSYYSLIINIETMPDNIKLRKTAIVDKYFLIHNSFEMIASYLYSFFPPQETQTVLSYSESNYSFLLEKINDSIRHLLRSLNEFFLLLRAEIDFESQDIYYRPENKANNQNLLSTHDSLSSFLEHLSSNLQNYLREIQTNDRSLLVRGSYPAIQYSSSIEKRAQNFASLVNSQPNWISVPYHQAVHNLTFIKEVEQKKITYESTISSFKIKLAEEERTKQRIMNEFSQTKDALASKQSQMNSLLTELATSRQQFDSLKVMLDQKEQEVVSSSSNSFNDEFKKLDLMNESLKLAVSAKETESRYSMTVINENGDQQNSLNVSQLDKDRELSIKDHYKAKRAQLLSQLKEADSKALKYYFELENTLKELNYCKTEHQECKKLLDESVLNLKTAEDDLESTRKNYEDQMKMLAEHFGKLNDQIAEREDIITKLKGHKVHCGRCGIWNTVAWLITEGNNGRKCSRGNHPSSYNFN